MREAEKVYNSRRSDKRNTALRRHKRKHNASSFMLLFVCLGLIAITTLIILSLTVFFKVDTIRVIGKSRYSSAEIIKASALKTGVNLLRVNGNFAKSNIKEKLPYIDEVKINKNLPSEILVTIKEAVPVGQIEDNKKYIIIDKNNKVLEVRKNKPLKGFPVIRGVKLSIMDSGKKAVFADSEMKNDLATIFKEIKNVNLKKITVISFLDPLNVSITYNNKFVLEFGSISELNIKLTYAKAIIEEPKNLNRTGRLTLSIVKDYKPYGLYDPSDLSPLQVADVLE